MTFETATRDADASLTPTLTLTVPTTLLEARAAIAEILAALPEGALPTPDRIEQDEKYGPIAWFGGDGHHYLSSRDANGDHYPDGYRESGTWDAVKGEALRRMSIRDYPTGRQA